MNTSLNTVVLDVIASHLKKPGKSVLTLHRSPDGDSVGSNLALYHVLRSLGHTVTIYSKDPVPEKLHFLHEVQEIQVLPPEEIPFDQYDVYWALDMAEQHMLGSELTLPTHLPVITIDHHVSNPGWGTINLIQPESIAAAEVLCDVFRALNIRITPEIATCLMTGLATDSGFFKYCRSHAPFEVAAHLIKEGAAYQNMVISITKEQTLEDLQFIGKGLDLMKIVPEKRCCYIAISYDVFLAYCAMDDTRTDLLTTYLSSVHGTDYGILIVEKEPQSFRISFRAKNDSVDVSAKAAQIGGGGHRAAAGARIDGTSFEEVVTLLTSL